MAMQLDETVARDKGTYRDMIGRIIGVVVWIPYFNFSWRARNTFVNVLHEDEGDQGNNTAPLTVAESTDRGEAAVQ